MTPQDRLARDEAAPALVRLHRALSRLGSVLTVMNTGAHPDDEQSGLLAWLRFGIGMRVIVACSTRGEGGQNHLGPERGGALGLLRSREMEEAARVLDCDVVWLGHGPDDPVHDFGFSKDGDATFARWGEDRVVERMVRAYRTERPDIVIPTFLDVPGQHGHHCAMTRAARAALPLAADPSAYPDHMEAGLRPWTVAKLYLPAWSGGGTYDDEIPPPSTTLQETATGRDTATGADYARIGEWSRLRHASQGMGHWSDDPRTQWNLHLVDGADERSIADGLPVSLRDLAIRLPAACKTLTEAADRTEAARTAFPDRAAIVTHLAAADAALEQAETTLAPDPGMNAAHGHRICAQRRAVQAAMVEAAGISPEIRIDPPTLTPGQTGRIDIRLPPPCVDGVDNLSITPALPAGIRATQTALTPGSLHHIDATAAADADCSQPFAPGWTALGGNQGGSVTLHADIGGRKISAAFDLETPLAILPKSTLDARPDAFIRRRNAPAEPLAFRLGGDLTGLDLTLPNGWHITRKGPDAWLRAPAHPAPGLAKITASFDGRPAMRRSTVSYPHIGTVEYLEPAEIRILHLDLDLPQDARIGWIGGGSDRTDIWMRRVGLHVTDLDRIGPATDLSAFTTLVIGVVALDTRPDVLANLPAIHAFVVAGGNLVTLYQRPDAGWDPGSVPPKRLVVGTPSLRWRVTDPAADVTPLDPDHPVLNLPNRIGPQDWAGWDKERGLYFASEWDAAYKPLILLSDPGELALEGALVSARIGAGRHTHVALSLHHQLDRMVPGAFRLLANLVRPER